MQLQNKLAAKNNELSAKDRKIMRLEDKVQSLSEELSEETVRHLTRELERRKRRSRAPPPEERECRSESRGDDAESAEEKRAVRKEKNPKKSTRVKTEKERSPKLRN